MRAFLWVTNTRTALLTVYSLFCFSDYNTKFPSGGEDRTRPLWNGEGSVAKLELLENMWSHAGLSLHWFQTYEDICLNLQGNF